MKFVCSIIGPLLVSVASSVAAPTGHCKVRPRGGPYTNPLHTPIPVNKVSDQSYTLQKWDGGQAASAKPATKHPLHGLPPPGAPLPGNVVHAEGSKEINWNCITQ
ncbi:hypothetical protein LshimejAT787_1600590 [Lyophyllum shimeji]|uniref:Uncharacterized protein n=1 Tax=Lyophyllum shimeji TaxID=47721 RepID=A0A9P3PZ27_LYOSH|nr:hypothetical protein LshimejAT787_1600590 [Lyophyllum shimeji]